VDGCQKAKVFSYVTMGYNFCPMRYALALLFALTSIALAVDNQSSRTQDKGSAQQTNPPTPVSVNCNCTTPANDAKDKPRGWHKLIAWPDGIATIALIFTLFAIIWQAWATSKATNAMRESTDLQRMSWYQWLEFDNLRGGAVICQTEDEGDQYLDFLIDIVNPTERILELKALSWTMYTTGGVRVEPQRGDIMLSATLQPKGRHDTALGYDLSPLQVIPFKNSTPIELRMVGTVDFVNALGTHQTFPFDISFHTRQGDGVLIVKHFKSAAWSLAKRHQKKSEQQN
jgi:hypothetical protein